MNRVSRWGWSAKQRGGKLRRADPVPGFVIPMTSRGLAVYTGQ
jgi:hypothetical protein